MIRLIESSFDRAVRPTVASVYEEQADGVRHGRRNAPEGAAPTSRRHTASLICVRRRKDKEPSQEIVPVTPSKPEADDRAWSSRRNVGERDARKDLVPYMALPAETGPTWAPDQLSIWPVEGGRFGIDAHYHGTTGKERARQQAVRLQRVHLAVSVRDHEDGAALRLGPLAHKATFLAIEAFLGRPIEDE